MMLSLCCSRPDCTPDQNIAQDSLAAKLSGPQGLTEPQVDLLKDQVTYTLLSDQRVGGSKGVSTVFAAAE